MATLTADSPRIFETGHDELIDGKPVAAATKIYDGAAVGDNGSGLMRPLVAGDPFEGFAYRQADNSSGAASAIRVDLKTRGVVKLNVVGVTGVTNEDATVYAADDNTFTLTLTSNTAIGKVKRWETGTTCLVYFEAVHARSL